MAGFKEAISVVVEKSKEKKIPSPKPEHKKRIFSKRVKTKEEVEKNSSSEENVMVSFPNGA